MNVHIDGEFAFSLAADSAWALSPGEQIDEGRARELLERDANERAYQRGVRFLAARPRSVAEVRRRLRSAGIDEEAIQRAIERLENEELVDDDLFASYWVGQRQTFRPRGPRALRFELRARGVSNEAITPAIEAVADEQSDAACRAGIREARRRCTAGEVEFSRAVTDYLVRRGFDFAATRIAVRQLWSMVETDLVADA
jgi:regulatory protein